MLDRFVDISGESVAALLAKREERRERKIEAEQRELASMAIQQAAAEQNAREEEQREAQRAAKAAELERERLETAEHMPVFLDLYGKVEGMLKNTGVEEATGSPLSEMRWYTSPEIPIAEQDGIVQSATLITMNRKSGILRKKPGFVGYQLSLKDAENPYAKVTERVQGLDLVDDSILRGLDTVEKLKQVIEAVNVQIRHS